MLHHSFIKGWQWDSRVIEGCQISDSVAELLRDKLKNLPRDVLLGLQICSVFGIQIEQRIIDFIKDFDGDNSVDINAGLKAVLELGLVEMSTNNAFKFSNDLLAESALDLIEEDDRSKLLQKLASSLIKNATAANEFESVIYVAGRLLLGEYCSCQECLCS
jgi:ATP-dependent RNA helicase DDX31/DBP7